MIEHELTMSIGVRSLSKRVIHHGLTMSLLKIERRVIHHGLTAGRKEFVENRKKSNSPWIDSGT